MKYLSVRDIRKILFDTDKNALCGKVEMSNKEARDFFYEKEDQNALFLVAESKKSLLISEY